MKKVTAIVLTFLMAVTLAACAKNSQPSNTGVSDTRLNTPAETTIADKTTKEQIETTIADEATEKQDNTADNSEGAEENAFGTDNDTDRAKVLVAYFSATNTTKDVAENLAGGLGADLYEIVPETPYTDADLNYHDDNSRTTIEMNDPNARPAISGSVENMEQYDVVFLGYPIWWGEAPRIINTFVETYDFNDKTIIPFCTSGGSGMGSSATNLHSATSGATWLDGSRFSGSVSGDELVEWANGLGLDF
ncbi:MAG: flavodoxin [Lachnospiraceae bacterium]|nr:flavodoxin [Lachnospiraceae bacterium]